MSYSGDFIESELKFILDKLNNMCKRFNTKLSDDHIKPKSIKRGSEANSGDKRSS